MEIIRNRAVKRVIIVGGGFAGLNLALELLRDSNYYITLIDRNNYNYFPPLLYQVATGFLDASGISYPFRKLFRNKRLAYRMGEVERVAPESQIVFLKGDGLLGYDFLVFAAGAKSNFFGIENIEKNAIPMKTIDDALRMRNSLYTKLEAAATEQDQDKRQQLLNIVIAGGGPTGVEVAGMLAEIKKNILSKEYPELKGQYGDIYIVDGGANLLGPMSEKSHQDAYWVLSELGVKIILHTHVLDFEGGEVKLSNGDVISAQTLIWAAGITANTFDGIPAESLGAGKRMITDEFNQVKNLADVFAIGDISIQLGSAEYPKGHPQLAQVAIQQGKTLAKNLVATAGERPLTPFTYFDKGEMAIIGRRHAVVDLFKQKVHLRGLIALLTWLFIHLISLVNVANKVRTLLTWTVAYLSRDQSLRMIYRPEQIMAIEDPEPVKVYRNDVIKPAEAGAAEEC